MEANESPNFYVLSFKYTEEVDGQVVMLADSEEHAISLTKGTVPPLVKDFNVTEVTEVDKASETYANLLAVWKQRLAPAPQQMLN